MVMFVAIKLNIFMRSIVVLIIATLGGHFDKCCCTEYSYAGCQIADFRNAECAECCYAKC